MPESSVSSMWCGALSSVLNSHSMSVCCADVVVVVVELQTPEHYLRNAGGACGRRTT